MSKSFGPIDEVFTKITEGWDLYDIAEKLLNHRIEKINDLTRSEFNTSWRNYVFLVPDTIFFTYGRGVRLCSMTESYNENAWLQIYFGTIDDSEMSVTLHFQTFEEMHKSYDVLKEVIHTPMVLSLYGHENIKIQDIEDHTKLFKGIMDSIFENHLRKEVNYYADYWFN